MHLPALTLSSLAGACKGGMIFKKVQKRSTVTQSYSSTVQEPRFQLVSLDIKVCVFSTKHRAHLYGSHFPLPLFLPFQLVYMRGLQG